MDFALKPSLVATQSASRNRLNAQLEIAQQQLAESDRKCAESDRKRAEVSGELNLAKLKIQALVMELSHLKRMRFGQSSEAMSAPHGDLFSDAAALALEIENAALAADAA